MECYQMLGCSLHGSSDVTSGSIPLVCGDGILRLCSLFVYVLAVSTSLLCRGWVDITSDGGILVFCDFCNLGAGLGKSTKMRPCRLRIYPESSPCLNSDSPKHTKDMAPLPPMSHTTFSSVEEGVLHRCSGFVRVVFWTSLGGSGIFLLTCWSTLYPKPCFQELLGC